MPTEHASTSSPLDRLALLVLAAGGSTRMGRPKALIELDGRPLLEHLLSQPMLDNLADVVVVLGHHADQIRPVVEGCRRRAALNPSPDRGRTGSIQIGLNSLHGDIDAAFIQPVDCPLIYPETYGVLARGRRDADVAVPTLRDKSGHPPLVAARLFPAILAADADRPLRDLISAPGVARNTIPVDDPGVLLNVDRPEDLDRLKKHYALYEKRRRPESS